MQGSVSTEQKREHGLLDTVAPISLALALFTSAARGQALQDLPAADSRPPREPPVPVLTAEALRTPAPVETNFTNAVGGRQAVASTNAPSPGLAADKALNPPENALERFLTSVKQFAYNLAGSQTVDLVVVAFTAASVAIGSWWIALTARRKLYPEALSSYVLEPVPRANGFNEEYLSTRTVTGSETTLKSVFGCAPHLRRAVRNAEKDAKKHPELPILFISSRKMEPEVFTFLRTAISSTLAASPHVQATIKNSSVRYRQMIEKITGKSPPRPESEFVHMEKVFLAFTYERYDSISARLLVLPVKDVISLLVDPERWFDAAHRIPVAQDRDAALKRLSRQLEVATVLVFDRPGMFDQYLSNQPEVKAEFKKSATELKKLLLLLPKESLEFVERWMTVRAEARKASRQPCCGEMAALSPAEETKLAALLCNTNANDPEPEELNPHALLESPTGAKPPYSLPRRSNWHAVVDIPEPR